MLVSHTKRFIYTKTAKTAGTSVEAFFEPFCREPGNQEFRPETESRVSSYGIIGYRGVLKRFARWPLIGEKWYAHMPAEQIKRRVGSKIWSEYFKFCVVRNPFDKVISGFHYFEKLQRHGDWDEINRLDSLPARFARWVETRVASRKILADRNRYVIHGKFCLDFVIRYERLSEGIQHVCERVGIDRDVELPHLLAGYRPKKTRLDDYYDAKTRRIVEEVFDFELEHFGYRYEES